MPGGCRQKSSVTSSNRFEALLTANFDPCEPVEPRSNHASARSAGKTAPSAIAPTFAPARVKREWKTIADSAPKEASTSHVHLLRKSMSSVTILQYNVLAQNYTSSRIFPETSRRYLKAAYRRRAIVEDLKWHIEKYDVDILCLQELTVDEVARYESDLAEFDGVSYMRRTNVAARDKRDGSGIFWRCSRFKESLPPSPRAKCHVEFNAIADDPVLSRVCSPVSLYVRDCIGALTCLTELETGVKLVVGSAHLFWDPEFEILKLAQAGVFRRAAFNLAEAADCANVVIAGDLNSLADSVTYQFLTKDHTDGHGAVANVPSEVLCAATARAKLDGGLQSFVPLGELSSDVEKDGPLSTLTHKFRGCLDHILASPECEISGHLSLPTSADFSEARIGALPCAGHPSDHLPQIARFSVRTDIETKGMIEVCEQISGLKI